jgi:hypothetical protein
LFKLKTYWIKLKWHENLKDYIDLFLEWIKSPIKKALYIKFIKNVKNVKIRWERPLDMLWGFREKKKKVFLKKSDLACLKS